ncbi:MAG TPA: hypothetical protein VFG54_03785 [Prolixibacteraceae bacterium]|nr:hypothetical protein [Prolixibacteraceae bacterium]
MQNQGTFNRIIDDINRIWPFKESVILIEDRVDENMISILGHPDLTFEIQIGNCTFLSQPVVFCVMRYIDISVTWDLEKADPIRFYIDGQDVISINYTQDRLVITHPPTSYNINLNNDGEFDCTWEEWRFDLFDKTKDDGSGLLRRRNKHLLVYKSIDEQFEELGLSIISLKEHLRNFSGNDNLLLFNILPILRSLLYWNDKSKTYNPLLFRLAGFLNYRLPVYTYSEEKRQQQRDFFKDATFSYMDSVSLSMKSSLDNQIDFQEWLSMKVILNETEFSNKDIIGYAANTMSFAHFDVDIYSVLKELINKRFMESSMLKDILILIANLSIYFGEGILKKYYGDGE